MGQKSPHYQHLAKKWIKKRQSLSRQLWEKNKEALTWVVDHLPHKHHIAIGSMAGLSLFSNPIFAAIPAVPKIHEIHDESLSENGLLVSELLPYVPEDVRPLTVEEEQQIGGILSDRFGVTASAELDGMRLNRSYGLIGAEQHLARYPGDTMHTHFDNSQDAAMYGRSGMAPGLGAWGYFAPSKSAMTKEDSEREKYYIAVQSFLVPDYNSRVHEYREFFKYRKMLVVNPYNGKAVVAVIGDAGPAEWTGKHLGGSPEVMRHVERVDGAKKGPVLYFFIDDPENKVPLGPIQVQ